ncbi:MAG: glycosyltransferase [Butyrivibrio sp.]|nr:glycosyltransferase [Butyrivibrio sp.]
MSTKLPKVSFCLLTYNQEEYIEDAMQAAFNQDYGNMELIVSDDCSTDATVAIIRKMITEYSGNHSVRLNVNKHNIGIRENVNKVLYELSSGDIVLLAAGDDVSLPNRTSVYVNYFMAFPNVSNISCMSEEVDDKLKPLYPEKKYSNNFSLFTKEDYIMFRDFSIYSGDSRGLRRTVIESFPPLRYPEAEDIFLFIRALLIGDGIFIRTPLVKRRHHQKNASMAPFSKKIYNGHKLQVESDLKYALEKAYIDKDLYTKFLDKNIYLLDFYKLYCVPVYSSLKAFIYRVLRKLFGVIKL